jgi:hypothetical protein
MKIEHICDFPREPPTFFLHFILNMMPCDNVKPHKSFRSENKNKKEKNFNENKNFFFLSFNQIIFN